MWWTLSLSLMKIPVARINIAHKWQTICVYQESSSSLSDLHDCLAFWIILVGPRQHVPYYVFSLYIGETCSHTEQNMKLRAVNVKDHRENSTAYDKNEKPKLCKILNIWAHWQTLEQIEGQHSILVDFLGDRFWSQPRRPSEGKRRHSGYTRDQQSQIW